MVSELCKACEEYLYGALINEVYEKLLETSFQRLQNDYYIRKLSEAGDERRDELVKHTIDCILASLKAGWEKAIGFIIMDTSAQGKLTTGRRVFTGMLVKSVAREFFKGGRSFSQNQIKEFLLKIGDVAQNEMEKMIKKSEERKIELEKEYKRIFPLLKRAIEEYEKTEKDTEYL